VHPNPRKRGGAHENERDQMTDLMFNVLFFFFQAEDGIRDRNVTGVQTCALPISKTGGRAGSCRSAVMQGPVDGDVKRSSRISPKIGRASCRERVEIWGGGGGLKKKKRRRGEDVETEVVEQWRWGGA